MKTNVHVPVYTHEGASSTKVSAYDALRRSVMSCMLWEDNFYEDGKQIVDRISDLCQKVSRNQIMLLAQESHTAGFLRHVPLKLIVEGLKKPSDGIRDSDIISLVCSRPDQMTELLSLYWKDGRKPLAAQLKKGLAKAFTRFDEYQLAKYNRDAPIKLKDVLFLCHAKPKDEAQAELFKRIISNTLKTPDTWEVKLSAGNDKKQSFEDLLKEGKMGKLAILRNLRNMHESGVDKDLVSKELIKKSRPILPFQFISAAIAVPQWEDIIDQSMIQSVEDKEKLRGLTVVFVDVSGSMQSGKVSSKSEITCQDAAASLAILLREVCEKYEFFTFSEAIALVPPRRGMALRDAINVSQPNRGTHLGKALQVFEQNRTSIKVDRMIVITDEQTYDTPPKMSIDRCYILNISTCKNGIKNNGQWETISGFSESYIDYIQEIEKDPM